MYKAFLVDDEIVIREGIRNSFHWDASGFTLCGEAPDGEMAFPMIQDLKPDILITDIRMPFMDGLTLARKVSQALPWTHIIILSGYDDFKYAQEAISIGVKHYLLKPVSAQKLAETLEAVAANIRREREKQADVDLVMGQLASSARYARERVVTQLLEGRSTPALLDEAQALGLPLKARHYLVIQLGEVAAREKSALTGTLHRLVDKQGGNTCCTTLLESPAILLVQPEQSGEAQDDLEERAYSRGGGAWSMRRGKTTSRCQPSLSGRLSPICRSCPRRWLPRG